MGKGTPPLVLVHYLGFMGVVLAPFDALVETWTMPVGVDLVYMALLGVFAFAGQFLFNAGVQREKAGVSSLVRNLDIVFAFIYQLTVEGVAVNGFSFIGACIVTGSVVGLGIRKWRKEKKSAPQVTAPVADIKPAELEMEAEAEAVLNDVVMDSAASDKPLR